MDEMEKKWIELYGHKVSSTLREYAEVAMIDYEFLKARKV